MVSATKETPIGTELPLTLPSITDQICQAARYWKRLLEGMHEPPYPVQTDRIEPLVREWFEVQFGTGIRKFYNEYDK